VTRAKFLARQVRQRDQNYTVLAPVTHGDTFGLQLTGVCIIVYSFHFWKCLYVMFVVPSVTTATWCLSTFVDLLWWSIMHPTCRDLVIWLLEGSENPISALFNFYAGKTSEKLVLPTIVCQIDGILQHLHCWKCFPREGSHRTFYPLTNNPFFSTNYHSAVTGIFHLFCQ
jgi:hypothetical protein